MEILFILILLLNISNLKTIKVKYITIILKLKYRNGNFLTKITLFIKPH